MKSTDHAVYLSACAQLNTCCTRTSFVDRWVNRVAMGRGPKLTCRMTGTRQDIFRCMMHACTPRGQSSLPCSKLQLTKNIDLSTSSRIMHPKLSHAPSVLTVHRSWTTVPVLPTWQRACDLCIARPLSLATLPPAIPNLSFGRSRKTRATPTPLLGVH